MQQQKCKWIFYKVEEREEKKQRWRKGEGEKEKEKEKRRKKHGISCHLLSLVVPCWHFLALSGTSWYFWTLLCTLGPSLTSFGLVVFVTMWQCLALFGTSWHCLALMLLVKNYDRECFLKYVFIIYSQDARICHVIKISMSLKLQQRDKNSKQSSSSEIKSPDCSTHVI